MSRWSNVADPVLFDTVTDLDPVPYMHYTMRIHNEQVDQYCGSGSLYYVYRSGSGSLTISGFNITKIVEKEEKLIANTGTKVRYLNVLAV